MNTKQPFVSVIIPVFNGEQFLADAIESVLAQQYQLMEIIVVNDGSTDSTEEIAKNFGNKIKYVKQENQGPPVARNNGLKNAQGSIIGFLDSDDLWPSGRLQPMLNCFAVNQNAEIVIGLTRWIRLEEIDEKEQKRRKNTFNQIPEKAVVCPQVGSALYKKSVFDKVGLFDPSLSHSDDQDWFIRAREKNSVIKALNQVTLIARRHKSNMTRNKDWEDLNLIKILKKSLDRRRQNNKGVAKPIQKFSDFIESDNDSSDNNSKGDK